AVNRGHADLPQPNRLRVARLARFRNPGLLSRRICQTPVMEYLHAMCSGVLRILALGGAVLVSSTALAAISINEVMADNRDLANPDGSVSDWVELYNDSSEPVSLAGHSLTDTTDQPRRWVVPANVTIPANGYL